tara:strand:- start:633 stop:1481 length:849 start_codon:yes stop_codon:yes gene_type:complete
MLSKKTQISIFKKAALNRNFEELTYKYIESKKINFPTYLSAGQELISATIAQMCYELKCKPMIFAQHRCHSTYLSFGGDITKLIDELLGMKSGCTGGMGGSASIHSKKIKMYGHDGHMGTQLPIGVGSCFASKKPTIVFLGDASTEEDYVMGALGWISLKKLPIVIVIEDNDLSILTEKKIRRNWEMDNVGKAFNIESFNINDNPKDIYNLKNKFFKKPLLININTHRLFWHAGAGRDSDKTFDRYKNEKKKLGMIASKIHFKQNNDLVKLWEKRYAIRSKI